MAQIMSSFAAVEVEDETLNLQFKFDLIKPLRLLSENYVDVFETWKYRALLVCFLNLIILLYIN